GSRGRTSRAARRRSPGTCCCRRRSTRVAAEPRPARSGGGVLGSGRLLEEGEVAPVALLLELVDRDEAQRRRVDAVAKPGRCGTIREDVAQVRVRILGAYLGAVHEQPAVVPLDDVLLVERPREARPPGARVELVERAEERLARDDVDVDARL